MIDKSKENQNALSRWDNQGGVRAADSRSKAGSSGAPVERRRSQRDRVNASHDSDVRGEHRYPMRI